MQDPSGFSGPSVQVDRDDLIGEFRRCVEEAFALEQVAKTEGPSLVLCDRLKLLWHRTDDHARALLKRSATEADEFAAQIEARIWLDGGLTRSWDEPRDQQPYADVTSRV